jgi:hypothetical protein
LQKSPNAVKTPSLPPHHQSADPEGGVDGQNAEANGGGDGVEQIPSPPPRPVAENGGRRFVNPDKEGTKAAAHYFFPAVPAKGGCVVIRLKLSQKTPDEDPSIIDEELFDDQVEDRRIDGDEFYSRVARGPISDDLRNIMRQALSGMLWTKQYYQFIQREWIEGDDGQPPPPPERKFVRNRVSYSHPRDCEQRQSARLTCTLCFDRNGSICTSTTSFRCQTNGSTHGSPRESVTIAP